MPAPVMRPRLADPTGLTSPSSAAGPRGATSRPFPPIPIPSLPYPPPKAMAARRPATITRRLAAIAYVHLLKGHPPPSLSERLRATMSGIRRVKGSRTEPKAPATLDIIEKLAQICGPDLRGLRARAIILLGIRRGAATLRAWRPRDGSHLRRRGTAPLSSRLKDGPGGDQFHGN
jgi:hypothetical protein